LCVPHKTLAAGTRPHRGMRPNFTGPSCVLRTIAGEER